MTGQLEILLNPQAYAEAMKGLALEENGLQICLRPVPTWLYRIPDGECVVMYTRCLSEKGGKHDSINSI